MLGTNRLCLFALIVVLYAVTFIKVAESLLISTPKKQNVIFMVSDGMGPAALALARSFKQYRDDLPIDGVLTLDKHFIGSSRTRSSDSLVTDSAAGATAFSCALKSYNSAVGVSPDQQPCGTILEALKLQGYLTGLVVTTRITDATPALFSAHVDYRFQEDMIAEQQLGDYPLGRMVDLMIGGGRCHFHPISDGGCRRDSVNLLKKAVKNGWTYVDDRLSFDSLQKGDNVTLPLLALLTERDIPFDLDRDLAEFPSLEEQTITALNALSNASKDNDKGFFLLVEGSRIDHAGHANDPAAHVREVLAYDKAFKAVIDFAEKSDEDVIVISTSDHETGGLAVARQVTTTYPDYLWYPSVLLNATHSGEYLARKLARFSGDDLETFIAKEIFETDLGITDYTSAEVQQVMNGPSVAVLNNLVSLRSQTGWSTTGHSQVDVNIYGYANNDNLMTKLQKKLGGNHENIEIGKFMEEWFNVDLSKVTDMVKSTKHTEFIDDFDLNESKRKIILDILHSNRQEIDFFQLDK